MDDAELARLEHENYAAAGWRLCSSVEGARVERHDGVLVALTGLPLRLFNQVIVESDDASPDTLADLVAIARERSNRFVVTLRAGTDDRLEPTMRNLGLVRLPEDPWMPAMAMHPTTATPPTDDGFEIRRVMDAAGVADHVRASAEGFGAPEAVIAAIVNPETFGSPDVSVYAGYADGEPVSSGLGIRTGRTIGVYNIATIERARRRGYGGAMTSRIVADGAGAGCDVAVLQASSMGLPIYERLGFRTVVEYVAWVDPSTLPQPADVG